MSSRTSRSTREKCFCCLVRGRSSIESVSLTQLALANTPHNPVRFPDTIGIVIEAARPETSHGRCPFLLHRTIHLDGSSHIDSLQWYCRDPSHAKPTIIHRETFHVTDLGTQLKPVIQRWMLTEELRKCKGCGNVATAK